MDAGDLGEAQPGLGLVLGPARLDAAGEQQAGAAADPTALRDAGEVRRRRRGDAGGAQEHGVETHAAQRRPQSQSAGAPAPEPGQRDDLVNRRNAVGEVDRRRRADQHDPGGGVARAQGAQERCRLQGFGHSAVHHHRDIHSRTV